METKEECISLNINSSRIITILLGIVTVLVLASVITQSLRFLIMDPELHRFSRFNLDEEGNIPTYFSTIILLFSAILLGVISLFKKKEHDPYRIHWVILFLIFAFMSLDEAAAVHEMTIVPLRTLLNAGGFFHYAWIIPGAVFCIVVAITFFKFWLHLEHWVRILFLLAAISYISGAIGLESLGGFYVDANTEIDFTYVLITTMEETLELIGIVLFISALLRYLVLSHQKACIRLTFK